ncbi:MAG: diaminopimelate epimerase [Gemmatimonadaceae bacterium]
MADTPRADLMVEAPSSARRQTFYKMSGSGNDFVFFVARTGNVSRFETTESVTRLCARGTGVGADGVVVIRPTPAGDDADVSLRYYNADGSRASLCGNATLCTANLAVHLGMVNPSGFRIATDAGVVRADVRDGVPGFELPPVSDAADTVKGIPCSGSEQRLGYATAGVPHIVIRVPELAETDVLGRGRSVRHDPALPTGANVNFVAPLSDGSGAWQIRTYERGVEGETLACGTGSVASAILLRMWGEATGDVSLRTRSGQLLTVSCVQDASSGAWLPFLRGEGRLVFTGEVGSI